MTLSRVALVVVSLHDDKYNSKTDVNNSNAKEVDEVDEVDERDLHSVVNWVSHQCSATC